MRVRSVTPILNVSDVRASLAWFERLGWRTGFTWADPRIGVDDPGFASVVGDGTAEIFLCLDGQGSRGTRPPAFSFDESADGVWMSWFLDSADELEAMHARALELGLDVTMPPTDEPWGIREFHLRHPDGHTFRVGCETGAGEPS
jgi:catechol 2,3-dioxygenase-like lactoylglutathione lyase family enzyme